MRSRFRSPMRPCRTAAAGRHLRLSSWRARLCAFRIFAPNGDGTDIGDLADDRRHGREMAAGTRTLRPDRQPCSLHRGFALPDRLAAATERSCEADQRQHPGRLQGGRGTDHRHDPVAEPVRRDRRRTQFLRAPCCLPANLARCIISYLQSVFSRSCCSCLASASCRGNRSRSPWSR